MRIGFYAPFKPLGHPNPSGDLIIGTGLYDHLTAAGHHVEVTSSLRARWIYWKPWGLIRAAWERSRISQELRRRPIDLWLTYHCYYKAPDIMGPPICEHLHLPYVIFQGIYSTRVQRKWQTRPGFLYNRKALLAADLVLSNRRDDLLNLERLLPRKRLAYLPPGIYPDRFQRDDTARARIRREWGCQDTPVIVSAAMFRPDVKTEGLLKVIESCARLRRQGYDFFLVVAGDGKERNRLISRARTLLGDRVFFPGRIAREKMFELYSGGDLFVFPGINESLGMVYLEAQSCGLPVVAYNNGGIPEVVADGRTGILTRMHDDRDFDRAVASLLDSPEKRKQMGREAASHIRQSHDLKKNYGRLEELLTAVVLEKKSNEGRQCRKK